MSITSKYHQDHLELNTTNLNGRVSNRFLSFVDTFDLVEVTDFVQLFHIRFINQTTCIFLENQLIREFF